ncbi:MAG TPA: ABC transporter substrate-binding protein [Mesorhizobium sp.]|nr:ABC transporter substrate-binding protein [Mesorhizobium sp.]
MIWLALAAPAWAEGELSAANRLVSIGGSLTEIVHALGEEQRLVARDSTSTFPPEAATLPDVGYMRQLSPEGVLSVNPDGILALAGSGPPEAMEVLDRAGVPLVLVPETFSREGIIEKIKTVGQALDVPQKAEKLAAQVAADLAQAEASAAENQPKRVLFVLSVQGGKLLASGAGTAADGIIRMAGAVNAVQGYSGYKQLSDEAALLAAPDVVLMMDRAGEHSLDADALFDLPALRATPAAASKALIRMDGSYLLGFGPRTAGAVRDLAQGLSAHDGD